MSRRIHIRVGRRGKVKADFVGFPGDDCFDESESLQTALAHYGIRVNSQNLTPKTAEEIERELEAAAGEDLDKTKTGVSDPLRRK